MAQLNLNETLKNILNDSFDEDELESFRRKNEKSTFYYCLILDS